MSPVFLDTVGLIATWDSSDQWHQAAVEAYARLYQQRRPVMTTSAVLLECGNAAARRPYRQRVHPLWLAFEQNGSLIHPAADDLAAAWVAFGRGQAGDAGIVDHISFGVMKRLGLTDAFTNDRHFRAAGFKTLF